MSKKFDYIWSIKLTVSVNMNTGSDSEKKADFESLQNFLLNIESLNKLDSSFTKLNLFDILKIGRVEIRHSNVLAWIFDPKENHGLSDSFIKGFFHILINQNIVKEKKTAIKLLMMNYHNFSVRREWKHIDLLLVAEDEKVVVCIENKIDSSEHNDQLERYRCNILDEFSEQYTKFFVYLTPHGYEASDSEHWQPISYTDILLLIEKLLDELDLPNDSKFFLTHYKTILRREFVEDEDIIETCNEIYSKHKRALDLIFENRMDFYKQNYQFILAWVESKAKEGFITFDKKDSCKSYVRFSTPFLDKIFKPLPQGVFSAWNTSKSAYYEINNRDFMSVSLSVSAKNITPDSMHNAKIIYSFRQSRKRDFDKEWEWKRLENFGSKKLKNKYDENENIEKIIIETLDKAFEKISDFENKIKLHRDIIK